jgi:hypothetical protein
MEPEDLLPFYNSPPLAPTWARWIQSTSSHPLSLRCIWILFYHLSYRSSSVFFFQDFQPRPRVIYILFSDWSYNLYTLHYGRCWFETRTKKMDNPDIHVLLELNCKVAMVNKSYICLHWSFLGVVRINNLVSTCCGDCVLRVHQLV